MKEKIVRYGLILGSIVVLIIAFTQAGDAPYHVSSYDYSSGAGTLHKAYYNYQGDYPPLWIFYPDPSTGNPIADYSVLAYDDTNYWVDNDQGNNYEPNIWFNFTIAENPNNIDWIHITITAAENEDPEYGTCYIANFTQGGWSELFTIPAGATPVNSTINLTNSLTDLIDASNSQLVLACAGLNYDDGGKFMIDYVRVQVGNSTPSAPSATLAISLNEPDDDNSYELEFTDLIFNTTIDVTNGVIHNATLYTNFSGTWKFNQSNLSTITDNVKYSFDTALSHATVGSYIWGVHSCSVSGICNWSTNYTLTITDVTSTMAVTLNEPTNATTYYDSIEDIYFNGTCDITDGVIHNVSLWTNLSGTWKFNQTNQSTVSDNVKYTMDKSINNTGLGVYIWGFECCATDGICNMSQNYTIYVNQSVLKWGIEMLNTTTFIVENGTDFVFAANLSCSGTADCGRIDINLDPIKKYEEILSNVYYFNVSQWTNPIEHSYYKYDIVKQEIITIWNDEFGRFVNVTNTTTVKNIYYYYTYEYLPIYNVSVNQYDIVFDSRPFGFCNFNDTCLVCDTVDDGNADGVCQSGESCIRYCLEDTSLIQRNRVDSKALIKKIKDSIQII